MSRMLMRPTVWLLIASIVTTALPARSASGGSNITVKGPAYRYVLKEDRNPTVCKHMLVVFNRRFSDPWAAPPRPWSKDTERNYSAGSRYAFPRLPGVEHSTMATYEMRFSAQPTSPEFSAVPWKEGIAVPGGCPAARVCTGQGPEPILIAHFDFDNDGTVDTVIRNQFFRGYRAAHPAFEYLTVWRNQVFTIPGIADIWKLSHPKNHALTPIVTFGTYLRPFVYANRTYVAEYVRRFGHVAASGSPFRPDREDMLVHEYSFAGQRERITGRPLWTVRNVCDFAMNQLSER